jgi:hypothetical protein
MKLYKYWVAEKQRILIDGEQQEITCYGGSNLSTDDARIKAREKAEKIQRKIKGEKHLFDEYEVAIREEMLQIIDDHSVITRNRYGAQVLNVEDLMILDIDKPRESFGFGGLFKKKETGSDKTKIFDMVRKLATGPKYGEYGLRLYETYQGARVIVLGKSFDPRDSGTKIMMDEFNCDSLYTRLCIKQGCYRARLTPKPYRMNMRAYKVRFPRDGDDSEFQQWLEDYETGSRRYSVCKFIEQIGTSYPLDDAIRLHDEITGIDYVQPLA